MNRGRGAFSFLQSYQLLGKPPATLQRMAACLPSLGEQVAAWLLA